jgi:aspartyl-tRNA(Asn)/glutamyl-tRNA(Gln) amidotransferase subunit A
VNTESAKLTDLTIVEAVSAIRQKEISPLELVSACLELIAEVNPRLNAFITILFEEAEEQARLATEAVLKNNALQPLHGIPIGVKDIFGVKGVATTMGSSIVSVASTDSAVVEKLRTAGAIVIGKHNMHEFACGATGRQSHYGPVYNPWNTRYLAGGSSGGSTASVAAGLCLGALGSDTAGSVCVPAALCGVVGFRPTFGSVSRRGMVPLSWSLDHVGIIARTVEDASLLYDVVREFEHPYLFPRSYAMSELPLQVDSSLDNLTEVRVGIPRDFFFDGLDRDIQGAVCQAISDIEGLGASIEQVSLPNVEEAMEAHGIIMYSDAAAYYEERLKDDTSVFSKEVLARLRRGQAYKATEYAWARHIQTRWQKELYQLFEEIDVLITPTTRVPAPLVVETSSKRVSLISLTRLFNLAGNPAFSLPCGFTSTGMPIGFQVVSGLWDTRILIRIARLYEQTHSWFRQRPQISMAG